MSTRLELARESLRQLVKHVLDARGLPLQPVTYGELSRRIERRPGATDDSFGVGMGAILGVMGHLLEDVEGKWGEPIPHLQALAVRNDGELKGLPDVGLDEFWPDYPALSVAAKTRKVRAEYDRIAAFGTRWENVLAELALKPIAAAARRGNGGESQAHKELKWFVRLNPTLVGADSSFDGFVEYPLPTNDEIDVLFRSNDTCIAVEVKSRTSDLWSGDYERGIYQTIKYGAILSAMRVAGDGESRPKIKTTLVLESSLPTQMRALAQQLGVAVVEGVRPHDVVLPKRTPRYRTP